MKLWRIRRIASSYVDMNGAVVLAETEREAREMAAAEASDGLSFWLSDSVKCEDIDIGAPRFVMGDWPTG